MAGRAIEFHFDIVCPFAYLASRRVEEAAERANNAQVIWRPTLLGGLYRATKAPQGKDGSATDVMPLNKKLLNAQDLVREAERQGAPLKWNPKHPVRSLTALRLIAGAPEAKRPQVSRALYAAYWEDSLDIHSESVLRDIAALVGVSYDVALSPEARDALQCNTDLALERGAFGVPSFWVAGRLVYGQDRLVFVEKLLGVAKPQLLRLVRPPPGAIPPRGTTLEVFHDFASPWSFIGHTQIARVARELGVRLKLRPVLLGALFRAIGTPNMPMLALSEAKRAYGKQDMEDWVEWWGIKNFSFPPVFPVRTVLPLRVALVEPAVTDAVYAACWTGGVDIGDEAELRKVLASGGFDADTLVKKAAEAEIKAALRENTELAQTVGACGVPSYRVVLPDGASAMLGGGGSVIWGQDRLHVVEDCIASLAVASGHSARL